MLGVHGAANVGGQLSLFRGGWYLAAAGSAPPAKLTETEHRPIG
jgi:hypothetical protein